MKKSLVAVALLGAFAGSAMAAQVTLYGIVDEGLNFTRVKVDHEKAKNNFSLDSGIQSGSRWGLRGEEETGDGLIAGFSLEQGINADSGKAMNADRQFARESLVYVRGAFGEVALGRTGAINGAAGRYALGGRLGALGTSWGKYTAYAGALGIFNGRVDNSITYRSPKFAGAQVAVQYSLKMDETKAGRESTSESDRYLAASLTYDNGPLSLGLWADQVNKESVVNPDVDDSYSISLGASYNFGFVKPTIGFQYFKHQDKKINNSDYKINNLGGWGVNIGATAPLGNGTLLGAVAYVDADDDECLDYNRLVGSIGYTYNLSKRTNLYTMLSYGYEKVKEEGESEKTKALRAFAGIRHRF